MREQRQENHQLHKDVQRMAKNIKLTQNKEIVMENRELKLHSKKTIETMLKLREGLYKMKGEMKQTYVHLKNGNQVEA